MAKESTGLATFFKKLASFSAFLTIIIGVLALCGYQFHIEELKSIHPHFVDMNPASAIAFILAGMSLFIWNTSLREKQWVRSLGIIFAVIVFFAGGIKLTGIILGYFHDIPGGYDIYFDRLLYAEQLNDVLNKHQNRIAPNTAMNFLFSGSALILLYRNKEIRIINALSIVTFFIALLALIGYAYGVHNLIGFLRYIPMALNTSVAFLILTFGIIIAEPNKGIASLLVSEGAGGLLARKLIPAGIILPFILGYVRHLGQKINLYPYELGLSLNVVATIILFIFLFFRTAHILNEIDKERQLLIQKLRVGKAKDEALLESIGNGLIATDPDFRIIVINQAAELMLGYDAESTQNLKLGKDLPIIVDEAGGRVPFEKQPFWKAFKTKTKVATDRTTGLQYYYLRKDGSQFPVAITATPIKFENKIAGVIVVFRDLTEEIELEHSKNEFLFLASHQLKTPPSAIRWNAEMLLDGDFGKLKKPVEEKIKEIHEVSKKMIEMIENILNVSRLEMDTFIIEPHPLDLVKLSKEVLKEQKKFIQEKKQTIIEEHSPRLPLVPVDPVLMKIIFENLISNAIKYTPNKGKIKISIKKTLGSGKKPGTLKIAISDNGFGIPKEAQAKIFNKMFRADNVKNNIEGTGFGLYLIKVVLEKCGGKIWFESKEGKGSTFYVELPLKGMKKKEGTSKIHSSY